MKLIQVIGLCLTLSSCFIKEPNSSSDWCNQELRPELLELNEIQTSSIWFKTYEVSKNVYAIMEPYNFQEVISYLIIGNTRAILFDTGMGLESIAKLAKELTNLPIAVINSHTHFDHIGGNHEFDQILAMNTEYTHHWANHGWSHEMVKQEVRKDALCLNNLSHSDTATYRIKPFLITNYIEDGQILNLGGRLIEIISSPGHAPDAIALLDRENGLLWTGDSFYEATIWLFFDETDLKAYEQSIGKLAKLVPQLSKVFPAHNLPQANPLLLHDFKLAFSQVMSGQKIAEKENNYRSNNDQETLLYKFESFSFLIRKDHLD